MFKFTLNFFFFLTCTPSKLSGCSPVCCWMCKPHGSFTGKFMRGLTFIFPCISSIYLKYNQRDATFSRSVISINFYNIFPSHPRQQQAAVLVWQYPTLYVQFCARDDGRRNRLKHVEQFIELFHLIHDSIRQQYWFDNTRRCMYSSVLLMMGGGTAWNM